MAIAKNSGNKAGAMVAINEMMGAEMQASRLENLKTIPVVDNNKLSDEEKAMFDKVDIGKGTIPQDELLSKRLPEMPAGLVPIIEEIWLEEKVHIHRAHCCLYHILTSQTAGTFLDHYRPKALLISRLPC